MLGTHPFFGSLLARFRVVSPARDKIAVADQYYRWNAALALACIFLDSNRHLYIDRNVLELGAGGGFPSIVAVKNGARKVNH